MKQNTENWYEFRRKHVGASDQTHLHWSASWSLGWGALWDIKMGLAPEPLKNFYMDRGLDLEENARLMYSLEVEEEFHPSIVECKEYPYLSASLDARSDSGRIAEIKCPGEKDHAIAVSGQIPKKYIPQLCHQLFVTGADYVDYVSFDGTKIAIVKYERNEKLIKEIMGAAHSFWSHVVSKKRPLEDPHPDFDTRIPQVIKDDAIDEANWNYSLRKKIEEAGHLLDISNERLLLLCDLPRAKIGPVQIVSVSGHKKRSIRLCK